MVDDSVEYPELVDVLRYETADGPSYRSVPAGDGKQIVAVHEDEFRKRRQMRRLLLGIVVAVVVGYGILTGSGLLGGLAAGFVLFAGWRFEIDQNDLRPDLVDERIRRERATETYEIDSHSDDPWTDQQ
ncbi:hypothetical protein [Natrinema salinisoli]|uniref:hypothetical protein n=1 Tax=Natrinema salinisoli TaxID=2878535 RepID=UPI001CF0AE1D|nr:hypothetical protein [Natrinema salinisoli]